MTCESKYFPFIENIFYANYPDSELKIENIIPHPTNEFIVPNKKTVVRTDQSYRQ